MVVVDHKLGAFHADGAPTSLLRVETPVLCRSEAVLTKVAGIGAGVRRSDLHTVTTQSNAFWAGNVGIVEATRASWTLSTAWHAKTLVAPLTHCVAMLYN